MPVFVCHAHAQIGRLVGFAVHFAVGQANLRPVLRQFVVVGQFLRDVLNQLLGVQPRRPDRHHVTPMT